MTNGSARKHRIASPSPQRLAQTPKDTASPFTSETETDDSGITFVPRKYQSRLGSFDGDLDDTRELTRAGCLFSVPISSSSTLTPDSPQEGVKELEGGKGDSTSVKQSGTRQIGEKITETELMRRRRLLDSHIFD